MKITKKNWLLLIILVSVALRLIDAILLGNMVVDLPGITDQISYNTLAQRVVDGLGFSFPENWWPATRMNEPTAHWSYLYAFFLAGVYRLFGVAPLIARILQAILVGIFQPLLAYWIARKMFNEITGLIAAGWISVYAYFIYYSGALMTEMLYITAILGVFYLSLQLSKKSFSLWTSLGLGVLLGSTLLLRQLFILFIPFLVLWIIWSSRQAGVRVWLCNLAIVGAVCALMILPFTYFNYVRFHRFVLLNTNAGYVLFWGNHPIYGTQFVPILTPDMPSYYDLIPKELLSLDEAALDSALMQRGLQFITSDPARYISLSISRIPIYFTFWPTGDSGLISNATRVLSFGIALPFMLLGVFFSLRNSVNWKKDPLASPVLLLIAFILVYSAIHILTWTLVRYRLPVDAVLMPFAAFGGLEIARRLVSKFSHPVDIRATQ